MGGETVIWDIYRPLTLTILLFSDHLLVAVFFYKDGMYITARLCHGVAQGLELALQPLLGETALLSEDN